MNWRETDDERAIVIIKCYRAHFTVDNMRYIRFTVKTRKLIDYNLLYMYSIIKETRRMA